MQVNSVLVLESDIMATNGVVHFVNQVLYPGGTIYKSNDALSFYLTFVKAQP